MFSNEKNSNQTWKLAIQNANGLMDGADLDDANLNVASLNDTDLMAAVAAGDAKADSIFISRHLSFLLSICRYYLKNEAEAEEVAQDVFATIWQTP